MPMLGLTDQVTPVLLEPLTAALNACVCDAETVAFEGTTDRTTETGAGVGALDALTPAGAGALDAITPVLTGAGAGARGALTPALPGAGAGAIDALTPGLTPVPTVATRTVPGFGLPKLESNAIVDPSFERAARTCVQ
jgi:hypothetical protein